MSESEYMKEVLTNMLIQLRDRCADIADTYINASSAAGHIRTIELDVAVRDCMSHIAKGEQACTGLDPEMGFMLESANKGELAAYDYGCQGMMAALSAILDGKDTGAGVCNEPWASLRKRVLALKGEQARAVGVPLGYVFNARQGTDAEPHWLFTPKRMDNFDCIPVPHPPTTAGQQAVQPTSDNELPGMWERADFEGGLDEVRGPDWMPPGQQAGEGEFPRPDCWRTDTSETAADGVPRLDQPQQETP